VQTLEPIITGLPLFQGLKPEHVRLIAGCAANASFDAGEFLGRKGEPADRFWAIRQGLVALEIHSAGRGPLTIQTATDDAVVGWSWLVPPHVLHFDIRATTRTRALIFDGKCLRGKFETDHELGFELMQRFSRLFARRFEAMSLQLLDLYGNHVDAHD
jgi:CRP-like cAMP-binding protein